MILALLLSLPGLTAAASVAAYDWPQFDGDARHSGNDGQETSLSAANVSTLQPLFRAVLPSIADGAPAIAQHIATIAGTTDVTFVTTTDGRLIALDAHTGATIWNIQHGPGACHINNGTAACYTTSSPALDPNRQYVYTYGLDGFVHKHQVGNGVEVLTGGWPELATLKPFTEKGSSALTIAATPSGTYLYVTNGGYPGDQGDYQGHITAIDLATGQQHVFNANCSNQAVHFVETTGSPDCPAVQTAIWPRAGVVYDPDTNRIYTATGNGTFSLSQHHWGDSVIALNPDGTGTGGNPVDAYTPTNQSQLDAADLDLGSTAPAILPTPTGCGVPHLGLQGGKDGMIRLINLDNLSGHGGPGFTGGEISGSLVFVPGATQSGQGLMYAAPAVWVNPADGATWAIISTTSGSAGLRLACPGGVPKLTAIWQNTGAGTRSTSSPIVANNVLYYILNNATLVAADPASGGALWSSPINGGVHWQSPVVANGVLYLEDQNRGLAAWTVPVPVRLPTPRFSPSGGAPANGPEPPPRPGPNTVGSPAPAPTPRT
jgi:outer membrane protein assembly factor BamB